VQNILYIGEIAALCGAMLWAVSSLIFKKLDDHLTPSGLNLFKCTLAIVMLAITALIKSGVPVMAMKPFLLLLISGAVGVGLGDTAFFECMRHMGPRRTMLIGLIAPPLTVILAWVFLGESLSLLAWVGIAIVMAGVAWVVSEHSGGGEGDHKLGLGLFFGAIYAAGQSIGAVLTRMVLVESDADLLWSIVVRVAGGIITIVVMALIRRQSVLGIRKKPSFHVWQWAALATIMGTYLAMICQQTALRYAHAGIAQTLLMSSHLFLLPLGKFTGEKVGWRAVLGAVGAMGGIALLFMR